jgi:hypothetical protein
MQTAGVCGSCFRLCPSYHAFQFFDPSGELKRAWEDICQSVRELTRVVEVNKEFWGLTVQCGAVGMRTLAGKRVISTQQTGSMAHLLMDRGLVAWLRKLGGRRFGSNGIRFWSRTPNLTGRQRHGTVETFATTHGSLCPTNTFMFTDGTQKPRLRHLGAASLPSPRLRHQPKASDRWRDMESQGPDT